jgi:hypothetical protein
MIEHPCGAPTGVMPISKRFALSGSPRGLPRRWSAFTTPVIDRNNRPVFVVSHVKVRRVVFVEIHADDDPEKTADFRHMETLP